MTLQDIQSRLRQLADAGTLTFTTLAEEVPSAGTVATALPPIGTVVLTNATFGVSGAGAAQVLTIGAQIDWGVFTGVPVTMTVAEDPTFGGRYVAAMEIHAPSSAKLEIPGLHWFAFGDVVIGGSSTPYWFAASGLSQAAETYIGATALTGDAKTPLPVRIGTGPSETLLLSLDAAAVDLPSINDVLAAFGGIASFSLPATLDDLAHFALTDLSISFDPSGPSVESISVTAGNSSLSPAGWAVLPGTLWLQSYSIGLTVADPLGAALAGGMIAARATLGTVDVDVAAFLPASGGWRFEGEAGTETPIPIGELIRGIGSTFDVELPETLDAFTLKNFLFDFDTGTCDASGQFVADFLVGEKAVELSVSATMARGDKGYALTVDGKLEIGSATFEVTLARAGPKSFTASWSDPANPLDFAEIASAFGWDDVPPVPPDLDLALTGASLTYLFGDGSGDGTLVAEATSNEYGKAIFVVHSSAGKREYCFLLAIDETFSLSELPLVGEQLASIEQVRLDRFVVAIASPAPVSATIAAAIANAGDGYPKLPAGGLSGELVLAAQLDLGSEQRPLQLALGEATATPPGGSQGLPATSDGTVWYDVQKSFGPVAIQRIGARYRSGRLWFELDASLEAGPLTLTLEGLGAGSPLSTFSPTFSIEGIGVTYSQPPLEIAGGLVNLAPPGASYIEFEGGLTVGTADMMLEAFGYYGDEPGFPSMFVFGDVTHDFGGPPAFFVTGVALGFGYNTTVAIPAVDQVPQFPFVAALSDPTVFGAKPAPLDVLKAILATPPDPAWVTARAGGLWLAAGITFTSFELVRSQALLLVEDGAELVIALIGIARGQFPQAPPNEPPPKPYANVEMDLVVRFAPSEGVFSVQAVLADSSFVLDPACKLTGGFAFVVWFGDNAHAGDFIVTLGGYHPAFRPPSYYPAVPRLGFHWSLDSSITVQGGVYFALTPALLMVGGELDATYQSGNLKAWFDAHADVLIQWKPFWFDADIGITIGASYKIDLLLTSFTVSVELGCELEFWGPPSGGEVTVDWTVISFTIPFGHGNDGPTQSVHGWSDVELMLPATKTQSDGTATNVVLISPSNGLTPAGTKPVAGPPSATPAPWLVRGGIFGFRTASPIPATTVTIGQREAAFTGSKSFGVYPLAQVDAGWNRVSATHTVTIALKDKPGPTGDVSGAFSAVPLIGSVPSSLWGVNQRPGSTPPVPSGNAQVVPNQLTGVAFDVNPPQIGTSPGAVNVAGALSSVDLELPGAVLPLLDSATPQGDVPVASGETVEHILDAGTGIGSDAAAAARAATLDALHALGYALDASNDPMRTFAAALACELSADPLLVA